MPSYNRVILIGRLTRDPELRYTSGGLAIAKFSIAVDRRFKNQQGERVTDFFDCSAFRQKAEFVTNYVTKGRLVAIDGSIEINEATGQDGQKRRYINVICDNVETLDSQREGSGEGAAGGPGGGYNAGNAGGNTGGSGGAPRGAAGPAPDADADNGYFPDDDAAPPPSRPQSRPAPAAAGAGGGTGGGAGAQSGPAGGNAGGAARGAAPAGPRPQPAPAYPEDDFDDSDPFADQ